VFVSEDKHLGIGLPEPQKLLSNNGFNHFGNAPNGNGNLDF